MPDDQGGKDSWGDNWAQSFEEGFYDNLDGAADEKQALLIEVDAKGNSKVVEVARGVDAEKLIREAENNDVAVYQDVAGVQSLLQEAGGATDVPDEVYELISAMIGFAQDLDSEWKAQKQQAKPRAGEISTEFEFGPEDVKS